MDQFSLEPDKPPSMVPDTPDSSEKAASFGDLRKIKSEPVFCLRGKRNRSGKRVKCSGVTRDAAIVLCDSDEAGFSGNMLSSTLRTVDTDDEIHDIVELSSDEDSREKLSFTSVAISDECKDGRVLVNVDHPVDEDDIYLAPEISKVLKPHQIRGIRFLYNNLIDSVHQYQSYQGFGCILANSMGLGKTLQIIGFLEVLFRCLDLQCVLVITPVNVIQNWMLELHSWLDPSSRTHFPVAMISEEVLTLEARHKIIQTWLKQKGVLLVSYELYRSLVGATRKGVTDGFLWTEFYKALVDPGPDIIICDEGQRIKNTQACLSKVLNTVRTRRRIVITGFPLQNNLLEYWCMVDFVRPGYLGSASRFQKLFQRPIERGQSAESTAGQRTVMRARAHVLQELLTSIVYRRCSGALRQDIPPKTETVIFVGLTHRQKRIYRSMIRRVWKEQLSKKPILALKMASKIWNHPAVLWNCVKDDLIKSERKRHTSEESTEDCGNCWAMKKKLWKDFLPIDILESGKITLLFALLEASVAIGDKCLIFSGSIDSLDHLELLLSKRKKGKKMWKKDQNYYRMDGRTKSKERQEMINNFNRSDSDVMLFILSTRAGCLGVNLIGANRVIVLDVSWNPCHDSQAICRVYRYGQLKPCYIYRLVAEGTMEEGMYNRQVLKQELFERIVDARKDENDDLTKYKSQDLFPDSDWLDSKLTSEEAEALTSRCDDSVLSSVIKTHIDFITKMPVSHESLFADDLFCRLSTAQKQEANSTYEDLVVRSLS